MVTMHRRNQGGPPLVLLALISGLLMIAGDVVGLAVAGKFATVGFGSWTDIASAVSVSRDAVQAAAVLWFASAIPLAIYAATVHARLRNLGVRAPGATIALAGGLIAASMWLLAASLTWVTSRPELRATPSLVRAFVDAAYVTGGPAMLAGLGLLIAGIAVPALFAELLPRRLARAGLAIAVLAEVSTLVLLAVDAWALRWVVHTVALLWLLAVGALLPIRRAAPDTPTNSPATREVAGSTSTPEG
jgi:hypothetical protein